MTTTKRPATRPVAGRFVVGMVTISVEGAHDSGAIDNLTAFLSVARPQTRREQRIQECLLPIAGQPITLMGCCIRLNDRTSRRGIECVSKAADRFVRFQR